MPDLQKPSPEHLRARLESYQIEPLSYTPPLSIGFIADEHAVRLGFGDASWTAACRALDKWQMFPDWAEVARTAEQGQQPGQIVAMMVSICGLWWVNPCRILRRYDSACTHGFVYGTLPDHAECGEELFAIERREDDSVWYVIRAFSHPRHWMAWAAFPLARWWQCQFVRDSQAKMAHLCS